LLKPVNKVSRNDSKWLKREDMHAIEYLFPCYDSAYIWQFLMQAPDERQRTQQAGLPKCVLPFKRIDLYRCLAAIDPFLPGHPLSGNNPWLTVLFPAPVPGGKYPIQPDGEMDPPLPGFAILTDFLADYKFEP
jgi:hypothetical protein